MKAEKSAAKKHGDVMFIAYVYPGWHADKYRPGVNEWRLLDDFKPYFAGHLPPTLPQGGPYDDSKLQTAERHVDLALKYGIQAFSYFVYRSAEGLVLDSPMRLAQQAAATTSDRFFISGTWCVRLPHESFPVLPGDQLDLPDFDCARNHDGRQVDSSAEEVRDVQIQRLSVRDLAALYGMQNEDWRDAVAIPRGRHGDITIGTVVRALQDLAASIESGRCALGDVADALTSLGLENLALANVAKLTKELECISPGDDVLGHFTPRRLEELLGYQHYHSVTREE
jgi:hypothetical protein